MRDEPYGLLLGLAILILYEYYLAQAVLALAVGVVLCCVLEFVTLPLQCVKWGVATLLDALFWESVAKRP